MEQKKKTGCWNCKHLDYYESYFEENSPDGFMCNKREVDKFKTFPCNRKLTCFELDDSNRM